MPGRGWPRGSAARLRSGATRPAGAPHQLSAFGQRLVDFPLPPVSDRDRLVADFRYGDLAAPISRARLAEGASAVPCCAAGRACATATRAARSTSGRPCKAISGEPAGCAASRTRSSWSTARSRASISARGCCSTRGPGRDRGPRLRASPVRPSWRPARWPSPSPWTGTACGRALPAARLAYVTPSHQFPLGSVLSAGRRRDASGLGAAHRRLCHRGRL